jgi:hypothetical protein
MAGIRIAAAMAACAIVAVFAATGASGQGKPTNTCPPPFLAPLTFEQFLALPRTQAGLEAGVFTIEELEAGFPSLDKNANGVICATLPHGQEVSQSPFADFFYNVIDDMASTPN